MKRAAMMVLALAAPAVAAAQQVPAEQAALRAHVAYLASDAMKGRLPGTPEYDRAMAYVADQLAKAGAVPAGLDGAWIQPVPLATAAPAGQGSMALVGADGREVPLAFGTDFYPSIAFRPEVALDAPVVFVGHGVSAPGFGVDDYAGADVRGKLVAVFAGAPKSLPGEVRAHFGNAVTKAQEAARHGAVGVLTLFPATASVRTNLARLPGSWNQVRMTWAEADGQPFDPSAVPGAGTLTDAGTDKLFAGRPDLLARLRAAEGAGQRLAPAELPGRLRLRFANRLGQVRSGNVVGLIRGSDPALRGDHVVLTSHLDHVGVGAPRKGDAIYNGAMDNAAGVATLIEVARRFKAEGPPRRSILFAAVTAEEKGLVGADYLARHPVVPASSVVANVNVDMPLLFWDFTDMVVYGGTRSTLGPVADAALKARGVASVPDPQPDEGLFTRNDHYRFVQAGVPSISLKAGPGNGGAAADKAFRANHYHQPSDQIDLPIRWNQGVRFADSWYGVARGVADMAERPRWNEGDFFGTLYAGERR